MGVFFFDLMVFRNIQHYGIFDCNRSAHRYTLRLHAWNSHVLDTLCVNGARYDKLLCPLNTTMLSTAMHPKPAKIDYKYMYKNIAFR